MAYSKTCQSTYISGSNGTVAGTVAGAAGKRILLLGVKCAADQDGRYTLTGVTTAAGGTNVIDADRYSSAKPATGWLVGDRPRQCQEGAELRFSAISSAAANVDAVIFWDMEDPNT